MRLLLLLLLINGIMAHFSSNVRLDCSCTCYPYTYSIRTRPPTPRPTFPVQQFPPFRVAHLKDSAESESEDEP